MSLVGGSGVNHLIAYTSGQANGLKFRLGDKGTNRTGKFVFCQASGSITQYDFVSISEGYVATSATTTSVSTTPKSGGWAQVAATTGQYLWIWIGEGGGTGFGIKGRVAASYVANTKIYTTATAGVVDDTSTAGVITGAVGITTDGGSGSAVELFATGMVRINN